MRIDISSALVGIQGAKDIWERIAPQMPQQENIQGQGVGVADITQVFEEVIVLARTVCESEIDGVAWCLHKANIDQIPSAMAQFFQANANNPSQFSANPQQLCNWLWSLKTSLLQMLPIHPESARLSPDFQRQMTAKIAEAQDWFRQAEDLKSKIGAIETRASEAYGTLNTTQLQASEVIETVQTALSAIQGHEREASTAKTNAESSATTAATEASSVSKLSQDLLTSVEIKAKLFKEFEDRRDEIAGLLENANKVGLAKSFSDKRKELSTTWRVWAVVFIGGISGLSWIGLTEILPLLKSGSLDPTSVAVRFLVVSPLVWLTWFAARQYGHVLRVSEDYAFKEAAAMAYAGYRNEMGSDPDMLKRLQDSAIKNFGANPAEMLLKRADAASPLHDALEKALEKLDPKQITDLVTSLAATLKK